jgi:hypothetical protein
VLGSPEFDGVEIPVERLLEELTEDLLHMIILLIRSIWVACVMSTWRDHVLRGEYYMSHRWIWDLGIIHRLIHYCLRTSNIRAGYQWHSGCGRGALCSDLNTRDIWICRPRRRGMTWRQMTICIPISMGRVSHLFWGVH